MPLVTVESLNRLSWRPPVPPIVVSLINLKGGVGKTTTTVQLAECLVAEFGKKVLVVDLDPQTNATISLIDETKWEALNSSGQTISQLFKDKLENTATFNISTAVQIGVSNLGLGKLSLLPSSIDLIQVQDRMGDIAHKTAFTLNPMEVLKITVAGILNQFDYVLIDCPPNLGFITRNGIEISDYYLIPTIPDTLSTYGIPQIVHSIHDFGVQRSLKIRCLGLVVTKFDSRSSAHRLGVQTLPTRFAKAFQDRGLPPSRFFDAIIPQSNKSAEGTEVTKIPSTFREKWGYSSSGGKKLHEYVTDLSKEFMAHAVR
jgi:chromosome partitioning protein